MKKTDIDIEMKKTEGEILSLFVCFSVCGGVGRGRAGTRWDALGRAERQERLREPWNQSRPAAQVRRMLNLEGLKDRR